MKQVMSDPLYNATDLSKFFEIKDPRWLASEDWIKMQNVVYFHDEKVVIHFVYNTIFGVFDDFKFADKYY